MDIITTAIVAAIAAISSSAIKDSYSAFKALLKKKFGEKSDLVEAVNKLEAKPQSEARKATVQEEVKTSKASDNPEIVQLAEDLLNKLKDEPGGQQIVNQIEQKQNNTVSKNTVNGDLNFSPDQTGIKDT